MSAQLLSRLTAQAAACHGGGNDARAYELYRRILIVQPADPAFLNNFGAAARGRQQKARAAACFIHALALQPDFAEAAYNLGLLFHDSGHLDVAIAAYRGALAAQPDHVAALGNLLRCREEISGLDDPTPDYRRILRLDPNNELAARNLVSTLLYHPSDDPTAPLQAARRWAAGQAAPSPRHSSRTKPRLGFLSGDFRRHAVGHLLLPALTALRDAGYDLRCVMTLNRSDPMTAQFRSLAQGWRDIHDLSDAQACTAIRSDRIDILFDLAGFTAGGRPALLARRLAPLQIAWLGFPASSGLAAMDYLLGDPWQLPDGAEALYHERLLRLPHSYILFAPPDSPPPGPLPALRRGHLTFGSFNAAKKLNRRVIALWSEILRALPSSRLLLKAETFSLAASQTLYRQEFERHGVAAQRLDFIGSTDRDAHLAAMRSVDVALDPFPYSGGQTTLEALWSGLPVLTWPQAGMAGRHAASYLANIGLDRLIASDGADYCAKAVDLASDHAALAALRDGMRSRILAAPLADRDLFLADFSAMLEQVWRQRR